MKRILIFGDQRWFNLMAENRSAGDPLQLFGFESHEDALRQLQTGGYDGVISSGSMGKFLELANAFNNDSKFILLTAGVPGDSEKTAKERGIRIWEKQNYDKELVKEFFLEVVEGKTVDENSEGKVKSV